jgi:hypothetical protein
MPAQSACVLDSETQYKMLEILDALRAETATIEINGEPVSVDELKEAIASCSNDAGPAPKTGKKRGPKTPSEYNLFIGNCRTPTEKGGQGKEFTECVQMWRAQKGSTA